VSDNKTVWIGLDRVRDPGNLGTIIRTADACGADGIILIGDTTDPFSLEATRATMGSIFNVPLARMTQEAFLAWQKAWPGLTVGTHLEGATDFRLIDYHASPVFLLMGNEQQGLTPQLALACDQLALIPMHGRADSLNLAIATGVFLFQMGKRLPPVDKGESK
ncbi:MAG: RNA methyltransferase, partial [Pseudomonadota bacterium]